MIIDGEKWACEACVRGHRVSNCQHSDRPLQHINKKGRPVSQCQHCRSMRKSRQSHVKCDCGEKSHKCAHLKTTVEGHRDSCCCNHGGRCTCSHKKEPGLDPVPESDSDDHATTVSATASCGVPSKSAAATKQAAAPKGGAVRSRRRANTIHSDGSSSLMFDESGRHKPTYKHAKASSKCEPYPLKRVNSVHSTSSLPNRSPADSPAAVGYGTAELASGPEAAARRAVKSEATSPLLTPGFSQINSQLAPLDLSSIEYPRYVPGTGSAGFDLFGTGALADHEGPMFSAGLTAPHVDWSHYDGLDFGRSGGDGFASSSYGRGTHGYAGAGGFDFNGSEQAPTMTTATSGDVSEVEDFMGPGGTDEFDVGGAFGAAYGGLASGATADLSALEYEDLGAVSKVQAALGAAGSATKLYTTSSAAEDSVLAAVPTSAAFADDPLFWINDYSHGLPVMDNSTPDPNGLYNWDTR
ncbi:hypothetical protein MAPG_11122 [Magnaporthiopsis poae ATCC 64411]|uniref:Copper-fist domain-containing protein n=1 Tax=Magnaporthiopsis poae (strain ATCC 64411 / 73-15) TaxID=644358 RepID=A0A0C4EEE9_MAGP6|nr:hypothetical protein MAPG_11122 [Magnaporthiopsis poae ATCC 64411]